VRPQRRVVKLRDGPGGSSQRKAHATGHVPKLRQARVRVFHRREYTQEPPGRDAFRADTALGSAGFVALPCV
jgi:hypothetical protein